MALAFQIVLAVLLLCQGPVLSAVTGPTQKWYVLDVKWFKQWKSYVGYDNMGQCNVGEDSSHPCQIDNAPIFQEGTEKLKEHLIDDLDYVLVPEDGWNRLLSWYGMLDEQKPLPRRVIEEGQLEQIRRVEFNIAPEKEVRLWHRYMTNMYEQLNKKDNTLQEAGLYQGQLIVIEQRNTDGTWPRDKLRQGTPLENN